jgi:hypothetical protein
VALKIERQRRHHLVAGIRQEESKMITSAEGLRLLDIWKMRRTLLWLAVPNSHELEGPVVRIVEVSAEPAEVVFDLGGGGDLEPLDLHEALFETSDSQAAMFPKAVTKRFGFFLNMTLPDGREFVLAQQVQ